MSAIVLHEYAASGNCYKIRLLLAHRGLSYTRREYDILKGETRTPEFLSRINANGRIPVLEIDGHMLPESNAALWYLAEGTDLLPSDRFGRADVLRWLFWEQYNHEPNIATVRFWLSYLGKDNLSPAQLAALPGKVEGGCAALKLMEEHLSHHAYFVGEQFSIADIALFAYTHVAPEGSFDLAPYAHVQQWIAQIEAMPAHVAIGAGYK